MDHTHSALLTRCTFGLWLAAALPGCFSSSLAETGSTETGNPPAVGAIQASLVYADAHDGGFVVVGRPGAVSPGGTDIEVHNRTSGERVRAVANADGSFEVAIDGNPSDAIEVSVVGSDTATTLRVGGLGMEADAGSASVSADELACACEPGRELRWQISWQTNQATMPTHVLSSDCGVYEFRSVDGNGDCMQALRGCATGEITTALLDPEVMAVFQAADEFYGFQAEGIETWEIVTDTNYLSLGGPCDGRSNCREVTPALARLRDALIGFADGHMGCEP